MNIFPIESIISNLTSSYQKKGTWDDNDICIKKDVDRNSKIYIASKSINFDEFCRITDRLILIYNNNKIAIGSFYEKLLDQCGPNDNQIKSNLLHAWEICKNKVDLLQKIQTLFSLNINKVNLIADQKIQGIDVHSTVDRMIKILEYAKSIPQDVYYLHQDFSKMIGIHEKLLENLITNTSKAEDPGSSQLYLFHSITL